MSADRRGEEPGRRLHVSLPRHVQVDDLPVLVNGAVHVAPGPGHLHVGFVDEPPVTDGVAARPRCDADSSTMTDHARPIIGSPERTLFVAMVACCAVPMATIIVLTSVVGLALGSAAAIALGLVAAGLSIAVMVHHRVHHANRVPVGDEHP